MTPLGIFIKIHYSSDDVFLTFYHIILFISKKNIVPILLYCSLIFINYYVRDKTENILQKSKYKQL